jgi:glycosyltransferase involved in cell wall biosynthesis
VPITVLFLGNIGDRKGAFTLIDAWSRVLSDWTGPVEPRLVLAGDGQVERASRRIVELGLSAHARVVGWAAPADVEELLRSSQILVLPSRSEGQPMAVLEAMAHGLCVVATQVGGLSDMIDQDCAVVVPVDDSVALAEALLRVMVDGDERVRLGKAALQRVRDRFDVEVTWRAIDALYREVTR